MADLQLGPSLIVLGYVLLSSLAGQWLALLAPWRKDIAQTGVPRAVGLILAPFLLGFLALVCLALPGDKPRTLFVYGPLIILAFPAALGLRARLRASKPVQPDWVPGAFVLRILWFLWVAILLVNAHLYILMQNDSLEYAIVGRLLFDTGSLASYPAISPETSANGFYGPWTHPPLYVSLITLANFVQGHADEPGLMRFISPWFLIAASYGVLVLGLQISSRTGAFAAVILISTPLLFLGTDSALLDALTVASFVLLMAALFGVDFSRNRTRLRAGIALGCVIGLGMWAHSQTILYFPVGLFLLAFLTQTHSLQDKLKLAATVIFIALLLASPAYVRNLYIFGTLISDEPAVFALKALDWKGYFDFARGLDHPVAILQYGLFKGWFALEAYGFSYWFMTIGLALIASRGILTIRSFLRPSELLHTPSQLLLWTATALFACYFGGTLLSVLLGMNLMIKNERYLLATLPAVVLIGGYGLDRTSVWVASWMSSKRAFWCDAMLAVLLVAQVFALLSFLVVGMYYRFRLLPIESTKPINLNDLAQGVSSKPAPSVLGRGLDADFAFQAFPAFRTVEFMNEELPEGSVVLASRPADFYYLDHQMLSYLDVRLLPVYEETNPIKAAEMLHNLGVTHIYMVNYVLPPFYNSVLEEVIGDPALTTLLHDDDFFQVYSLSPESKTVREQRDFSQSTDPNGIKWASRTQWIIGGRKTLGAIQGSTTLFEQEAISESTFPWFHRDYSTIIIPTTLNKNDLRIPIFEELIPGQEYAFQFELEGTGFVRIWLAFYSGGINALVPLSGRHASLFYEIVLNEVSPRQTITRRFIAPEGGENITLKLEHLGRSNLQIHSTRLLQLSD